MKVRFILFGFSLTCLILIVTGIFNDARSYVTGAPAGVTGSPRDGTSCISCHSPRSNFTGAGSVTTNIPAAGYTAGQTYTVTTKVIRNGHVRFGFELSPQDTLASGAITGTLVITNSNTTQLTAGNTGYITHTDAGTSGTDSVSWSFNWTAPATGKGPVVFYAAFNVTNNNGQDNGDSVFLVSLKVYENICTTPAAPAGITGNTSPCSGTATTYSVSAVTGATAYVWTLPTGWTGTSTTNSITATSGTSGGTITVKATNSCGSSAASSLAVTVNATVAASVSIAASQNNICAGTSVTFTATPVNGGSSPSYRWQLNGSNVATGSSYTNSSLANGNIVACILTSDLACATGSPATSNSITMIVNPVILSSVSINGDSVICSGMDASFTATSVNGGSSPAYVWLKNGNIISGATSPTFASSTLLNSDVIAVQMTSDAQCVSPVTDTSRAISMHVSPALIPSISISSNSGTSICDGQSVTFTATAINGGTAPLYQWIKNGVDISGATASKDTSANIANGDVFNIRLTSNASCASPAVVLSDSITMTTVINAIPSVTISSAAGNTICAGQTISFSSVPVNGGSSPSYQWMNNGIDITGATSANYSSDSLSNGDGINVVMTSSSQCVSIRQAVSDTIEVTVVSSFIPSVSIVSNSGDSVCAGQDVTFIAMQTNGGTSPVYQWFDNSMPISGATSAAYTTSRLLNGDTISLQMASSLSCAAPDTAISNAVRMFVFPTGNAAVSVNSSAGNEICAGQSETFAAIPVNGGTSPSFQWMLNGNNIYGATDSSYTTGSLSTSDTIAVQMISSAFCVEPVPAVSTGLIITVLPTVVPMISISSNNGLDVCTGTELTFTASAANGGSLPVYQWEKNGAQVGTDRVNYSDNSLATGDILTCVLTSSLSCALPDTAISNLLTMNIFPLPTADITDSDGILSASPAVTWQWYMNDSAIAGATFSLYLTSMAGSYTVQVMDTHGCQNISLPYIIEATGISHVSDPLINEVYPNPTEGIVHIYLNGQNSDAVLVRVYDINGQLFIANDYQPGSDAKLELNLQLLASGIYIIQISRQEEYTYRKTIVSRQ